jgi:hypothetical protein
MTIQQLERNRVDTRTPGERLGVIWRGLGEEALRLDPRDELAATMAAIAIAADPTRVAEGVTLEDLYVEHLERSGELEVATIA